MALWRWAWPAMAAVGAGGFALSYWLFGQAANGEREGFADLQEFRAWAGLMGVFFVVTLVLAVPLWMWAIDVWRCQLVKRHFESGGRIAVAEIGVSYVLFAGVLILPQSLVTAGAWEELLRPWLPLSWSLTGLALVVAAPAVTAMMSIERSARDLSVAPSASEIPDLRVARSRLRRFLSALGAIIGLAVLATGALRSAVEACNKSQVLATGTPCHAVENFAESQVFYSPEVVLLFGGLLSGVVAAVYLPTFAALEKRGRVVVSQLFPKAEEPEHSDFLDHREKANALSELLGLGGSPGERFQSGVAVLAPLLSSLVGLLIGT